MTDTTTWTKGRGAAGGIVADERDELLELAELAALRTPARSGRTPDDYGDAIVSATARRLYCSA